MRLSTVRLPAATTRAAVEVDDRVMLLDAVDVGDWIRRPDWEAETRAVLARGSAATETMSAAEVEPGPVVVAPGKIICCGHNYRAHIAEMGRDEPAYPTLFGKFADTLTGARDDVVVPGHARSIDWEAELAVVVGSELSVASRDRARSAIAGYTVANDISMRDWQRRTPQWMQGKVFDATTPLGPVMVTADEVDPSDGLHITATVNGTRKQDASTADLLFDAADLLAYISQFTRLRPGDVVLTGTPGGVGAGEDPPRYLHDGDVVDIEIERIGQLRNTIRIRKD